MNPRGQHLDILLAKTLLHLMWDMLFNQGRNPSFNSLSTIHIRESGTLLVKGTKPFLGHLFGKRSPLSRKHANFLKSDYIGREKIFVMESPAAWSASSVEVENLRARV